MRSSVTRQSSRPPGHERRSAEQPLSWEDWLTVKASESLWTSRTAIIVAVLLAFAMMAASMYSRGKHYTNRLAHCNDPLYANDTSRFCGMATPDLAMPRALVEEIERFLLATDDDPRVARRVHIPGIKSGRTIITETLVRRLPSVIDYYEQLRHDISAVIGATVETTSLELPTSCAILLYDREGDGISWHYDVNYFAGRFFTVLIPVSTQQTCSVFLYRDRHAETVPLDVQAPPLLGKAIVFEGDLVYHMATALCREPSRVMLSLQFATDASITPWNRLMMFIKDRAFVGLWSY